MASFVASFIVLQSQQLIADDAIDSQNNEQQSGNEKSDKADLKVNRAYLDLIKNVNEIRSLRKQSDTIINELDGTAEMAESFQPISKAVKTIDTLYLHPKRSVTVMLPNEAKITHVTPTFDSKFLEYDEMHPSNVFTLLSMPSFSSGDLTVYYSIGDKNFVMKLICKKYAQKSDDMQMFHPVVAYVTPKEKSAFEVMEIYKKEFGSYPIRKYSFVTIEGVAYKIIEDQNYGTLTTPAGRKYRIETQVVQRN